MADKKADESIIGEIRQHLEESEDTCYRIARETGLSETILSRFRHGEGLRLTSLDKLCAYLGIHAVRTPPEAKPAKRTRTGKKKAKRRPRSTTSPDHPVERWTLIQGN